MFYNIVHTAPIFPSHFSPEACDVIRGLLTISETERLGSSSPLGAGDIMQTVFFFSTVNFDDLLTRDILPPFKPSESMSYYNSLKLKEEEAEVSRAFKRTEAARVLKLAEEAAKDSRALRQAEGEAEALRAVHVRDEKVRVLKKLREEEAKAVLVLKLAEEAAEVLRALMQAEGEAGALRALQLKEGDMEVARVLKMKEDKEKEVAWLLQIEVDFLDAEKKRKKCCTIL